MSDFRFELDTGGVRSLLQSGEMAGILAEYGSAMMGRLDDGYEMVSGQTSQRAKVNIRTATYKARRENSKNNTLLKAFGGG